MAKKLKKKIIIRKRIKLAKKPKKVLVKRKPAKSRRHLGGPVKMPRRAFVGKVKVKKVLRKAKKVTKKIVKKLGKKKVVKKKPVKNPIAHKTKIKHTKKPDKSARRILTGPSQSRHKASLVGEEFPAEALFKAKIKVVGVGGGGGSIVSEVSRSLQKATFVVADTDVRALKKKSGIKYFCFGQELTHGLGTGLNIDLAKRSAESAREKISSIFKDQDIVIFIASLGGGLGSGATQVFAETAKEFGGITLGIFTMPFKFEGANKYRIAQSALKSLKQSLNVSLVIPNEKIFKVINANTAITDAFSMVNKSLIESLESLIDLIYSPGIINIDFADLRSILSGIGNSAFLNTIEESGKDRAEKVCEKILINPLLQNSSFEVEKILLNVEGSSNLSMMEVEKISRKVSDLNPKAKIIFGISKNQKLKNKIKTTILMTGGGVKDKIIEDVPVVEKEKTEKLVKKPFGFDKSADSKRPKKEKIIKKKIKNKKRKLNNKKEESKEISLIPVPVFPVQQQEVVVMEEKKLSVVEAPSMPVKTAIRRSGLEIKKAEELEEKKRQQQEKEWEIPAFLRKVKYNK